MLNDFEIREGLDKGYLSIEPFDPQRLQPVSYDLTLSSEILVPRADVHTVDTGMADTSPDTEYYGAVPSWKPHMTDRTMPKNGWPVHCREFLLGCTNEVVSLSPNIAARVEGKSSLGRLGLAVHITAGFIDPGFKGQITLEIVNMAPYDLVLHAGMPIAQIVFEQVTPPERDYSQTGHYFGQMGPTASRYRFQR